MSNFSKLIAAVVAVGLAWLSTRFPGIVQCTPEVGGDQSCTVLGVIDQTQATAILMSILGPVAVFFAPANKPSA